MAGIEVSAAVAQLQNEGAYAVLAAATALEKQGKDIVHFEIGQPDYPTPKHVVDAGIEALTTGKTTYCNPSGTGDIKQAIAQHVSDTRGIDVTEDMVVVGPGCKPGLFFATMALVEKGDEVICPDPGFPTYANMIKVVGGVIVPVGLNADCSSFDMAALAAAVTPKTRVLILNSPSNPTGGVMPKADLDAIAVLAKANPRMWIFSDEIYARLVFDGQSIAPSYMSSARDHGVLDRAMMFDGFSKTYCMTGWRLGWAVMPPPLAERIHLLMVHSLGCTANFTQSAGVAALTGPQHAVDEMIQEYQRRRDYVIGRLNAMPGVTCATPKGAFYAFPNVEGTGMGCRELSEILLNTAGVAVLPGTDFGDKGEGHIRISYVRNMDILKEGLDRIEKCLVDLKK